MSAELGQADANAVQSGEYGNREDSVGRARMVKNRAHFNSNQQLKIIIKKLKNEFKIGVFILLYFYLYRKYIQVLKNKAS